MAINLSTGKVAFPITIDGHKDNIYLNPSDPDLSIRLKNFLDDFPNIIKAYEDIEVEQDGTPTTESNIARFDEMQKLLYKNIDIAFGSNVSEVAFKYCSPFAIVGDTFFFELFVNALGEELQKYNEKAFKGNKHIAKYHK